MKRPPRDPQEAIFSAKFLGSIAWFASLITAVTLIAFWIGLDEERASPRALTMSFMTLAVAQTLHLANARSREHVMTRRGFANPFALGAVVLVLLLQVLAVHWRPLAEVLRTEPLVARDWIVCVSFGMVPAIIGQVWRWFSMKRERRTRLAAPADAPASCPRARG
jgi:Ca2+-transporting ATPase